MSIPKTYKGQTYSLFKSILREVLSALLYYTGIVDLYRFLCNRSQNNGQIKILTYHNIGNSKYLNLDIPEKIFKKQIEFLIQNNYNIISLERAVSLLKSESIIQKDTIVITFDDGYKSMFTSVLPLVKKYKIPVTIFLPVEPLEKSFPLFADALVFAFEKTQEEKLDLTSRGLKEYSLETPFLKQRVLYDINSYSKTLPNHERVSLLELIFEQLRVDISCPELEQIMLSWDEIKKMAKHGVTFGAHTITHPVLSKIPLEDAMKEIVNSKRIIQEKLGEDIKFFAYPYGSIDSFDDHVVRSVKESDFICACTLVPGANKAGSSLFLLKRICITDDVLLRPRLIFSKAVFAAERSGLWDFLRFRGNY